MATQRPDITIIRGDSDTIQFTLERDNTPVDLTDSTVIFMAKAALDDADVAAAISVTVTDHSDPTNGTTEIDLSPTDTDVDPGNYYYDIEVVDIDGNVTSIHYRILEIVADVSRRTS